MKQVLRYWAGVFIAIIIVAEANSIDVNNIWFERSDKGYAIRARLSAGSERIVEQLLQSGYPVFFKLEIKFKQRRRWWLDETVGNISWSPKIYVDALLSRYTFESGDYTRQFADLNSALQRAAYLQGSAIDSPKFVDILNHPNAYLQARYEILIDRLPLPLQISLLTDEEDISSGWKTFNIKLEQ